MTRTFYFRRIEAILNPSPKKFFALQLETVEQAIVDGQAIEISRGHIYIIGVG